MDLVRDLLDKRVVDRNGRDLGRVDGIVLVVDERGTASVDRLEVGPAVLAARLSPTLGRWVEALEHALAIDAGRPTRIGVGQILTIGDAVKVDVAFSDTTAATLEQRLRRWVRRLPGSGR